MGVGKTGFVSEEDGRLIQKQVMKGLIRIEVGA